MPKRSSKKRPTKKTPLPQKDTQQLARHILDAVAPEVIGKADKPKKKNPAAVALGRLGGLKGGNRRHEVLSPERKREIAKLGAEKRWGKKKKTPAANNELRPPAP